MVDVDEEWELGAGSYREAALALKDREIITPNQAWAATQAVKRAKEDKIQKELSIMTVQECWDQKVAPRIQKESNSGSNDAYIFELSPERAQQLVKYGKSKGWRVKTISDGTGIVVNWGPRFTRADIKVLMGGGFLGLAWMIFVIITYLVRQ